MRRALIGRGLSLIAVAAGSLLEEEAELDCRAGEVLNFRFFQGKIR
jgi:hypothetical protein